MARTLIKDGIVVTGDPAIGDLNRGDVLIENDRIAAIGHGIEATDAEVIDARRMMVVPGLVQAHYHTWQTGIRNFGGNWTTPQYFRKIHGDIATRFTPDDIYYGTLIGALDQINCGTTTLFEWCHNNPTPEHSERAIDALEESGIRAVFAHGSPKPDPEPGHKPFSEIPQDAAEVARLRKGRLASNDALVTMALGILGPDFGVDEVLHQDLRLARELGLISSAHVWGAPWRLSPAGYATALAAGLIGPDHNVVHAVYSSDDEIKGLCDAGAACNPNRRGGLGKLTSRWTRINPSRTWHLRRCLDVHGKLAVIPAPEPGSIVVTGSAPPRPMDPGSGAGMTAERVAVVEAPSEVTNNLNRTPVGAFRHYTGGKMAPPT